MSNRKHARKQPATNKTHCSIPTFLVKYPDITDHRLRWALRHREANGLAIFIVQTAWAGRPLLLQHAAVYKFLTATVPA